VSVLTIDDLGSVFADALIEVISKSSGFSLCLLSAERDDILDEITGVMGLNGNKHSTIFISANEAAISTLCSFITGCPKEEITEQDIDDMICELVNMTAGNAKLRFCDSDYMFSLTSPFVIRGKSVVINTKKRTKVVSCLLGDGEISVKLKVVY
jgi:CheY-specific phosphatase CheX